MTPLPIHAVFSEALDVLESSRLPFAIMGGFAVRALGLPRPTYDGDLVVDANVEQSLDLFRRFDEAGFRIPEEFSRGFRDQLHGMEKVAIHKFEEGHDWRIDLFFPTTPLLKSAFERRKPLRFMGKERAVLTAEDIVLLKLLAGRTKDKLDIEELLKIHRSLDVAYLKLWAGKLDLAAELQEQLRTAGLPDA
ncbi:MAG: hypothetical protein HYY18_00440 [Planctomycetes bacterium]|nr:hypothetical protein [Planctomycetota bacterium]